MAQLEEGKFQFVSRREKWLKVFLFSTCIYLSLLEVFWIQICIDLWSSCMSWSWPVMTCMCLKRINYIYTSAYRCVNVFSTDCFWQNTAGASTKTPEEQMAPQICFKPWASWHSWKSWILPAVRRSQRGRGKKFAMPSGLTWRRQISDSASLREMVEGFLVFCFPLCLCWKLFEFRSIVRMMKLSYELELTWMGLR